MSAYNLIIQQGATFRLQITWTENDGVTPIDLTGFTARMMIRSDYSDVDSTLSLTDVLSANGQLLLGDVLGTVDWTIAATATAAIAAGVYVFDLELVNGADVYRIMEGHVVVSAEVTK